jgi:hypothetical protein
VVVLNGQTNLPEIVLTRGAAARFAGGLHGREQECRQDANDGDHNEQFDQRKGASGRIAGGGGIHDQPQFRESNYSPETQGERVLKIDFSCEGRLANGSQASIPLTGGLAVRS